MNLIARGFQSKCYCVWILIYLMSDGEERIWLYIFTLSFSVCLLINNDHPVV